MRMPLRDKRTIERTNCAKQDFNGKPIFIIYFQGKSMSPVKLGKNKVHWIVQNIEKLKDFLRECGVEEHDIN